MIEQLTPAAFLDSLRRRWWLPLVCLVLGVGAASLITKRLPKIYQASTLILVEPQKIPAAYVRPTVTTTIENRLRSLQQQITSRTRIERVIQDLNLFPERIGKVPMESLVGAVASRIRLEIRGTTTFKINYEGTNPEEVAAVVNKIADLFIAENSAARAQEARSTSEFLDKELEAVRQRLEREELEIARFKREHMGELPEQRDANLRTVEGLQARLRTATEALTRAQDRRLSLEGQLAALPASGGGDVNLIAVQLEQAKTRLQQLLTQYTEQHPEVALQRREIARLEDLLASSPEPDPNPAPRPGQSLFETRIRADLAAAETEIRALAAEQQQIRADIVKYQERVENAPRNEAALSTLTRDYENLKANYQSLLAKKLEAKLAENLETERQGEQFNILDRAVPPTVPFKPNLTQIVALGGVIGLLVGCAGAFVVDLAKPRFRSEDDLFTAHGIPVLAAVPRIDTEGERARLRRRRRVLVGSGLAAAAITVILALVLYATWG